MREAPGAPEGSNAALGPQALLLAEAVSLAVHVDRSLLRTARLAIPGAGPEVEAELHFSALVSERSPNGIALHPDVAAVLRRRLAAEPERLERAWAMTRARHATMSELLALEERINWHAARGDTPALRQELRDVVASLIDPERERLAAWAIDAIDRMAPEVRALDEFEMLALGAILRTGASERKLAGVSSEKAQGWLEWLAPRPAEMRRVGVALVEGGIEFGPPGSPRYADFIDVPDTASTLLTVTTQGGRTLFVTLRRDEHRVVGTMAPSLEITAPHGARWRVESVRAKAFMKRSTRSRIVYEIETYGAHKKVELPFVVGVMADLGRGKHLEPLEKRNFVDFHLDNFDQRLGQIKPEVMISYFDDWGNQEKYLVTVQKMEDFGPDGFIEQIPPARKLVETRGQLNDLLIYMDGKFNADRVLEAIMNNATPKTLVGLEDRAAAQSERPRDVDEAGIVRRIDALGHTNDNGTGQSASTDEFARLLVDAFRPRDADRARRIALATQTLVATSLETGSGPKGEGGQDIFALIDGMIAAIDAKISLIASQVLADPDFRALESAWRGLWFLVSRTETGVDLKIRVLNISHNELVEEAGRAAKGLHHSALHRCVNEMEFGQLGGEPYGVLVCDQAFAHHDADMDVLDFLANLGAAAHAPVLAAADPALLGMASWAQLSDPRDLDACMQTSEHTRWQAFRDRDESRFLALCMPRMLGRPLYGLTSGRTPVNRFAFEENADDPEPLPWINAAYGLASRITAAHREYGWTTRIRGAESGGTVDDLPMVIFPTDDGGMDQRCPSEIAISDRREAELSRAGLLPLIHRKNTNSATFIGSQTVHRPRDFATPEASAIATLGSRLPYILPMCRFVHYLKCIARDWVGKSRPAELVAADLQNWLLNYVSGSPETSSELQLAEYPLSYGKVNLVEPDEPGYLRLELFIVPVFQLEGMEVRLGTTFTVPEG